MKYFFLSVFNHFKQFFIDGLLYPLLFCAIILVFCFLFMKKRNITPNYKKIFLIFSVLLTLLVPIQLTVFSRLTRGKMDSLSNIYDGWLIKRYPYSFDLTPLENILMFIPFSFLLCFFLVKYKNFSTKTSLTISSVFTLLLSLIIEFSQLYLQIGTFQISDIVYNTLGGMIGGLIFILIRSKRKTTV